MARMVDLVKENVVGGIGARYRVGPECHHHVIRFCHPENSTSHQARCKNARLGEFVTEMSQLGLHKEKLLFRVG